MRSETLGNGTSSIEIHTSCSGIWLLVDDCEYFLPYQEFPWFKEARITDVYSVEMPNKQHLYWPTLDVDLDLKSLDNLEKYPLIYQ